MEREVLSTGIGGQGIQLAADVLARAATAEGREVLMFGSYGGMMRGGNTDASLVIGDSDISAPPVPPAAWAAIVMHHEHAPAMLTKLRPDGVAFINTSVVEGALGTGQATVVDVAATDIAVEVGNIITASLVMLGSVAAATGIVDLASLEAAVVEALPPYRRQHATLNIEALRAGFSAVTPATRPAWTAATATTPAEVAVPAQAAAR
jgi:Pyruvate/2-oxoacid:ferredoxin oxidoreductase gamma subunit